MLSPRRHNVTGGQQLLLEVGAALSLDRVVRRRLDGPSVEASRCGRDGLWSGVSPSVATWSAWAASLSPHGAASVADSG